MTPITSCGRPFRSMVRPSTSLAPPNRRCQSPCEITTTASFPGVSFSTVKSRPDHRLHLHDVEEVGGHRRAVQPLRFSPPPVRLNGVGVNAAMCANDVLWSRQST